MTTARLNQQVNRNRERFPEDFLLKLTRVEFDGLMLQFATSKKAGAAAANCPTPSPNTER
ncbi:MAG: ORF6N domain-containing protein [Pyrinomonadaceae bacterium]